MYINSVSDDYMKAIYKIFRSRLSVYTQETPTPPYNLFYGVYGYYV